jgi:hypothetical protein
MYTDRQHKTNIKGSECPTVAGKRELTYQWLLVKLMAETVSWWFFHKSLVGGRLAVMLGLWYPPVYCK